MSKRTIVCGAGGFIGGHLVSELLRQGHLVVGIDRKVFEEWEQLDDRAILVHADLSLLEECERLLCGADTVYNLAADMGGIGFIEGNKASCMLSVLTSTHLLKAACAAGVRRFFYSSSACVYAANKQANPANPGLKEEDAYPAMPEDGYGWEKLFTERMCRHFREDYGFETRVARYHNVYGPHGTWTGGREKAPAAICRKVAEAVLWKQQEIEIWGDGEQTRSFMYVDDCVRGTIAIAEGAHANPVNLGSAEMVTINQLVTIVEEIAGVRLNRKYNLDAPKGVRGRSSDNTKFRSVFGWEPSISLRDGMERTYRWVYDQVSKTI